ncbi:hypothetical protein NP233_g2072 [Leucocoprinus birnbaumii]|uniref:Cupredoxin n=1 Tax=Leucocoprinus birnbaumii TaxID=56174 RepID=A0AAD5VZI9_9AGAR|nr:hypothetical protein NP233_g2072 [Leucocoprinus birnbaumii]
MRALSALLVSLAALVSAEDFLVLVGQNNTLTYSPESVNAQAGDTISFRFLSKNHTVTQSTFADPCQPLTSPVPGVNSGFMPVPAGSTSFPQWTITLEDASSPLWFYCAQTGHCQAGMVFALNPTANKTFAAFQATAMGSSSSGSGAGSSGGATAVSSAGSLTASLTDISSTGAAATGTATSPTESTSTTSGTGSDSTGNNGAMSISMGGTVVLSSVMLVLGASVFMVV